MNNMFIFFAEYLKSTIGNLPEKYHWLVNIPDWVLDPFLDAALEHTYMETVFYTPLAIEEEFRGMGEGAGMEAGTLKRFNLIPELTRAWCNIVAAWGPASATGGLIQMRALDWDP